MKYVAMCAKGLEDISQLELKEIFNIDSEKLRPGRVVFETNEIENVITKTRSIIKILELKQVCNDIEKIEFFPVKGSFKVSCSRKGEHAFNSIYVEQEIGKKFYAEGNEVDLKNPDTIVFVDIVDKDVIVGIDLSPNLLSKREYRVRNHNQSVNACIAYDLVRLAEFDETKSLLDPFPKDGVIAVEAALFAKGKVFAFADVFPQVRNVEINAKLAGVRKQIKVSRIELEWFDTKLGKEEIDCVVSAVPYSSKKTSENEIIKLYKELWHQLDYIVKKGGKVVFISPKVDLLKEMNEKFILVDERIVATSNLEYSVVVFNK
tara:strand:- start:4817 stop:5773 length:957 start_codon:yes stop_codon:yes gene_type:complete